MNEGKKIFMFRVYEGRTNSDGNMEASIYYGDSLTSYEIKRESDSIWIAAIKDNKEYRRWNIKFVEQIEWMIEE